MIDPVALLHFELQIHRIYSFRFIPLQAEARAKININFMLPFKAANGYRVGIGQHRCFLAVRN